MNEPAFPSHGTMGEVAQEGMTLRDYFAAKAMQGLIYGLMTEKGQKQAANNMEDQGYVYGEIDKFVAKCAYDYADAMLEARKNGGKDESTSAG